jgi:hypothetical protein
MMALGLLIVVVSIGLGQVFEAYSLWITAVGVPIGLSVTIMGRKNNNRKNSSFENE